jgi:hypothetical protein
VCRGLILPVVVPQASEEALVSQRLAAEQEFCRLQAEYQHALQVRRLYRRWGDGADGILTIIFIIKCDRGVGLMGFYHQSCIYHQV